MFHKFKIAFLKEQDGQFSKTIALTGVLGVAVLAFQNCSPAEVDAPTSVSAASLGSSTPIVDGTSLGTGAAATSPTGTFNPIYLGTDNLTYIGRQTSSTSLQKDISFWVGGNGRFRFDANGVVNAYGGFAFNHSGDPIDPQAAMTYIMNSGATGLFGFWEPRLPNDIGVFIRGQGLFRFNEAGHFYAIGDVVAGKVLKSQQGMQLTASGDYVANQQAITSDAATGFFRNWEARLPNDIGVFINGDGKFRFHEGGDFIATRNVIATNVQTSSDRRLKTNIQPLEGSLEKLSHLNGVSFEWTKKGVEGRKSLGLIAQDVEMVYPELVQETDGYKSVGYSALIGPIVEALKELKTMISSQADQQAKLIEEQRLTIRKLEERLQRLEAQQAMGPVRAPASVR